MSQYGLKDIHFALLEDDSKTGVSYKEVEAILGAISAKINPSVDTQELYADDQLWESISALGKVEVEVETADLPLATRAKVLGNKFKNGLLVESKDDVYDGISSKELIPTILKCLNGVVGEVTDATG